MEGIIALTLSIGGLFIVLPWLILHYVTQWKKGATLSLQDEKLLDELHDLARRLDERMGTIERIVAADNPDFRPGLSRHTEADPDFRPRERNLDRRDAR